MYGDQYKEFVWGGDLGRALKFHSRKCSFYASFDLSVTHSIPTSNEQMIKLNYVLLHVNKFCVNL